LLTRQEKSRSEYLSYSQGILRSIGGKVSEKTCHSSIPLGLRHARINRKGDVQMKKFFKTIGMAIVEGCMAYAETFNY